MLLEFIKLTLFAIAIGVAGGLALNILFKASKKKAINNVKSVKVKRTITSLEHTGRNYTEWMEYVSILNSISDIRQDRDTSMNRKLTTWLESQNIFKINK